MLGYLNTLSLVIGKSTESKVWEVLIAQIWACFKGYCDLCTDLKEGFTTPFARLITNLLYTQPALRTSILQGLRQLVVTSQTLAQTSSSLEVDDSIDRRGFGITPAAAKESLTFLRSIASNMVSVLFNVFSSAGSEERGLAGEVISAWLGVLSEKVSASAKCELAEAISRMKILLCRISLRHIPELRQCSKMRCLNSSLHPRPAAPPSRIPCSIFSYLSSLTFPCPPTHPEPCLTRRLARI